MKVGPVMMFLSSVVVLFRFPMEKSRLLLGLGEKGKWVQCKYIPRLSFLPLTIQHTSKLHDLLLTLEEGHSHASCQNYVWS